MIRPARMGDIFRLVDLLVEQHGRSRYADTVVDVDAPYARKLLAQLIGRHGFTNEGGSFVMVEEVEGRVEAFVAGLLTRVYEIGTMLRANDLFLVAAPGATRAAMRALLDAYLEWAGASAKVFEIGLSWTDALPTGRRMDTVYRRMGFEQSGALYLRRVAG